jgi:hypothetical protein
MRYIIILFLIVLSCSCSYSRVEKNKSVVKISPSLENVVFKGKEKIAGYVYYFEQEKCPGTQLPEYDSPCVRRSFINSEFKIKDLKTYFQNDTLNVNKEYHFLVDEYKYLQMIPAYALNDTIPILKLFKDGKEFLAAIEYPFNLFLSLKESNNCESLNWSKINITECKLNGTQEALKFSLSKDLFTSATSPKSGNGNYGIPVFFNGDSVDVYWVIPPNSSILNRFK